jgi:ribosomal protein S18 acetylase RimI-like enzyme
MKAAIDQIHYNIRQMAHGDAAMLAAYFNSFSEATRAVFGGGPFDRVEAERLAREEVNNPSINRFVVTVLTKEGAREQIIGMVWFWEWLRKVPWFGISITDAYQNKGLGKAMMEHAIKEATKCGKGGILLTTAKTNVRGQALYARYGFEIIGVDSRGEHLMILNYKDA